MYKATHGGLAAKFMWFLIVTSAVVAFAVIGLYRGETINAIWVLTAGVCTYLIAYRFYSRYIARKVLQLDAARLTPAHTRNDGLDYVPTERSVLFGHHFAAIAGAGPLVGPVLAAQMGYLPGLLWILAGVVLAGAVQDMVVLFISTRRNGNSLGEIIRDEMGAIPGIIAMVGTFLIMIILLAVLAMIVVKALAESPWGTFTVAATIPIAFLMGIYARFIRPGKIGEVSIMGFVLLMLSIFGGQWVSLTPGWAEAFTLTPIQLTFALIAYGFIAAVIPVWLLLAPRDYLSTFLKIGTILALAIGIIVVFPTMQMPAMTQFVDGTGPVWSGKMFPFLFITIACGAVSGFHALIASGTTPKMINNEGDIRLVGYGAMLMESFVALMALIAASVIHPGIYFAMNAPAAIIGTTPEAVAQVVSSWGFVIRPEDLLQTAKDVGETTIISRAGGAPTLAVGMAEILHRAIGGKGMMAFWYHFAILFEALFILTAVDAGTRAGRFMLQDLLGVVHKGLRRTESLPANLLATAITVAFWGYFLYQGVVDPLGGINTLWPLFGIANQMLAGIALCLCTVILFKMKRDQFAWVTMLPALFILVCTSVAAYLKIFSSDPKIGFLANASKYADALSRGEITGAAKSAGDMSRIVSNGYVDAAMAAIFLVVMLSVAGYSVVRIVQARCIPEVTARETKAQWETV